MEKQPFNSVSLVFVLLFEVFVFWGFFVVVIVACFFETGSLFVASVPGLA